MLVLFTMATSTVISLFTGTYKISPKSFRERFSPFSDGHNLTHANLCAYAEQPKFEVTFLAPPADLVCMPDQGQFPCLS